MLHFVDLEVYKYLSSIKENNAEKVLFPSYSFIALALKSGLTYQDLKELTYIEVMKIIITLMDKNIEKSNNVRKSTQSDIDMFLG